MAKSGVLLILSSEMVRAEKSWTDDINSCNMQRLFDVDCEEDKIDTKVTMISYA